MPRLFVFVALLLVLCGPLPVSAQRSADSLTAELREIKSKIAREEKRLGELRERQRVFKKSLSKLKGELTRVSSRKKELREEIQVVTKRYEKLERAASRGKDRIVTQRDALSVRVAAIYKMYRRLGAAHYLFEADSAAELVKRSGYLRRIASYDHDRLDLLNSLVQEFRAEQTELSTIKKQRAERLEELAAVEQEVEEKNLEQATLLEESKHEEKLRAKTIAKLSKTASRLDRMLSRIMGSEEQPVVTRTDEPEQVTPTPGPQRSDQVVVVSPYPGRGLARLRGKLPLPVDGELVRRFGKQRHKEFSDMLFVKGLEFAAAAGAKVTAVATGKVILSQILPGYGSVVILDHGKRYYSLYARHASTVVRLGDIVTAGETIAVLGELDREGKNFYFELRHRGKPVNPVRYFRDKQKLQVG